MAGAGLLAIATALVAPGTSDAGAAAPTATESGPRPVLAARRSAPQPLTAPRLGLRRILAPAGGGDLAVFPAPGAPAPSQVLPAVNELGSPLVLLAVAAERDWYEVLVPTRPNGDTAWVPAAAVTASVPQFRAELSLAALELTIVRNADGAVMLTSPIGIGSPSRPTPTGLFFVRDHFPTEGANHPYGPMAYGLSGHSEVLTQFGTGDGRIAIHGTNQPSSIGQAVSNGCPHVPNDVALALLDYLPLGTPVLIS
jgi:lipoprotein-anchoring transpeptidase ErfK/SrfK